MCYLAKRWRGKTHTFFGMELVNHSTSWSSKPRSSKVHTALSNGVDMMDYLDKITNFWTRYVWGLYGSMFKSSALCLPFGLEFAIFSRATLSLSRLFWTCLKLTSINIVPWKPSRSRMIRIAGMSTGPRKTWNQGMFEAWNSATKSNA